MVRALQGGLILRLGLVFCSLLCAPLFAHANANADVEVEVRKFFADVPVMIEIARCESKFRQYDELGNTLNGGGSGGMVGVFQIYDIIHRAPALALGYDIDTLEGNMGYAKHLYTQSGTQPWNSAKSCWGNAVLQSATPAASDTQELQAKIALLSKLVAQLQALLALQTA